MSNLNTDYVRERQPPCDCGVCEIWKSLHDEALDEIDRLREEVEDYQKGVAEHDSKLWDEAGIEQHTKEACKKAIAELEHSLDKYEHLTRHDVEDAIDSVGKNIDKKSSV